MVQLWFKVKLRFRVSIFISHILIQMLNVSSEGTLLNESGLFGKASVSWCWGHRNESCLQSTLKNCWGQQSL